MFICAVCLLQTPTSSQPGASWRTDLAAYTLSQAGGAPPAGAKRDQLAGEVLAQPESAAAWWAFLEHEVCSCPAL